MSLNKNYEVPLTEVKLSRVDLWDRLKHSEEYV